eukprot:12949640-Alexandrium_andersonii.AAC.1
MGTSTPVYTAPMDVPPTRFAERGRAKRPQCLCWHWLARLVPLPRRARGHLLSGPASARLM